MNFNSVLNKQNILLGRISLSHIMQKSHTQKIPNPKKRGQRNYVVLQKELQRLKKCMQIK
jgi:hypothetical protein